MAASEQSTRTYGNWQKPRSAGILGLGSLGTGLLLAGLVIVVLVVMVGTLFQALATAGALGVLLILILTRDSHGKNMLTRGGERVGWWMSVASGAHLYRSGPLGRALWGTYQLPGLAAPMRLREYSDSYNRRFALLDTPATGHFTVVLRTEPDGAALVDPDQVDAWVAQWGYWLSGLSDEPGLEAVSVTIETAPDTGTRLRREVTRRLREDSPVFARSVLEEVVHSYPAGSSTVAAYIAVTFNAAHRSGGRKRRVDEMGHELAARLPGLTGSLQATGAGAARPLAAQELCEVVRVAYDPAAAILIEEAHAAGETPELRWPDVGPAAAEARWESYRHDSAQSSTWAMTVAPRGTVNSNILARLLAPHKDTVRKRVALLYRPVDAARAAAIVESDLRAAQFRMTSTAKPAARDAVAVRAAAATAGEEAAGAGLVMFGMLVTATVWHAKEAPDARAAIDNLAATARLRLRPVYGAQDSAFAASLPLGLVLPRHLRLPTGLQQKL